MVTGMRPIDEWWSEISDASREWLLENPGSSLVESVASDVVRAGGTLATGGYFSDDGGIRPHYST
jgi:hypothetical protein